MASRTSRKTRVLLAVLLLLLAALGIRQYGLQAPRPSPAVADRAAPGADDTESVTAPASPPPAAPAADPAQPVVLETRAESGVPIRIERRPSLDLPAQALHRLYPQLRPRAEAGEAIAQYQLGLLLYRCRDVPEDPAELARRVDTLYQTRRSDGWDVDDPAQTERTWREAFAQCRGVPQTERERYREWMRRAADQDLLEARLDLMFHLPQADYCQFIEQCTPAQREQMAALRERARRDVTAALAAGSVEALRIVGGWALNDEMGVPDPVEAYAHLSAYHQIQRARDRESDVARLLQSLRQRLRPVDLDAAAERARDLLSNPRCCLETR